MLPLPLLEGFHFISRRFKNFETSFIKKVLDLGLSPKREKDKDRAVSLFVAYSREILSGYSLG